MKVKVLKINEEKEEQALIQCYRVNDRIKSIMRFIKFADKTLTGYVDQQVTQIPLQATF